MAIICLTLTTAMAVSLVRLTLVSHQQVEREGWRVQSVWLAESALSRAASRRHVKADYTGEKWITENIGTQDESGVVSIVIKPDSRDDTRLTITATADFPNDPTDRVRTTRRRHIPREPQDKSPEPSEE